ncbi:hypothetical protein F4604DRAFT_1692457 [Suillus subluteus]|nr:hypothetical protein F4604DRAFT_1692457 [Suillus subluteus]
MARGTTKKIAAAINKPGQKAATASASALQEQREEARQTLLKAKGTRLQYASHLEWGRRFLVDILSIGTRAVPCPEGIDGGTEFEHNVGHLLRIQGYVEECIRLIYFCACVRGLRTLRKYYSKGETYHGPYHCDEGTGVVTGNPALSVAAQDMMEVLKNNEGAEGGSRNHALAMTVEDMQKLMAWSYSQCPDGIRHLMVRAFSTTGIMIWTRDGLPCHYNAIMLSYDAVMKTLTWICAEAGLTARYTSHYFRRGGARYRFMFAPLGERWSLSTIGGVDTLIRYLLDELTQYEKNHRDALCPIPREGDKSFNGDHILTAPITAAETRELKMSFDRELNRLSGKVEEVLDKLTLSLASSPYPSLLPSPSQPPISVQPTVCHQATHPPSLLSGTETSSIPSPVPVASASSPFPRIIPALQVPPSDHRQHCRGAAKKTAPIPGVGIPDLLRGQEAWLAAVKQWEDPAASIGGKALKDWPEEWYTGPMCTITGVKRNIRKVIAIEFYRLQRDHQVFLEAYPEATRGVKPLFDAIQRQREGHGEIPGRASKNGRPEVRASSSH